MFSKMTFEVLHDPFQPLYYDNPLHYCTHSYRNLGLVAIGQLPALTKINFKSFLNNLIFEIFELFYM